MRILEGPSRERMLERKPTTDSHLSIVSVCLLNEKQKEGIMQAIPMRRMGSGEEIAAAVLYLASAEAAYVTGQTLHVNGGMAMI